MNKIEKEIHKYWLKKRYEELNKSHDFILGCILVIGFVSTVAIICLMAIFGNFIGVVYSFICIFVIFIYLKSIDNKMEKIEKELEK